MSLIPQITLEQVVTKIQNKEPLPSVEVLYQGKYIGTLIVPSMEGGASIWDEIKTSAEFLGVRGNIVVPLNVIEQISSVQEAPLYVSDKPLKPRKQRKPQAKRHKVKV